MALAAALHELETHGYRWKDNRDPPKPQVDHSHNNSTESAIKALENTLKSLLQEVLRKEFRALGADLQEDLKNELRKRAAVSGNSVQVARGNTADESEPERPHSVPQKKSNGFRNEGTDSLFSTPGSRPQSSPAARGKSPVGPRSAGAPELPPLPGTLGDETVGDEVQAHEGVVFTKIDSGRSEADSRINTQIMARKRGTLFLSEEDGEKKKAGHRNGENQLIGPETPQSPATWRVLPPPADDPSVIEFPLSAGESDLQDNKLRVSPVAMFKTDSANSKRSQQVAANRTQGGVRFSEYDCPRDSFHEMHTSEDMPTLAVQEAVTEYKPGMANKSMEPNGTLAAWDNGKLDAGRTKVSRYSLRTSRVSMDSVGSQAMQPVSSQKSRLAHRLHGSIAMDQERMARPSIQSTIDALKTKKSLSMLDFVRLIVSSPTFDYVVCILLVGNACFMGVQVDAQVRYRGRVEPSTFRAVELFFCVAFTLELALRLGVYGYRFYCMSGWGWSIFDTILVGMQLFEEIFAAFVKADGDTESSGTSNIRVIRVLRIVRMLRVVRVLRLVRFVHDLRKVIYLIIASFWSFIWTAVLLGMMIYILGIFMTQIVADTWYDNPELTAEGMPLQDYFGTCGHSILSLYMAITGGADWEVMSGPLMEQISPFMGLIFCLYVMFATLVLLNLVTGVFVDGAMTLSKEDKQADLLKGVRKAFIHSDVDGTGAITHDEWLRVRETPEIQELLELIEVKDFQAINLFRMLDADGDGHLTVEEFASGALGLQGPIKALDFMMHTNILKDGLAELMEAMLHMQIYIGMPRKTVPDLMVIPGARPNRSSSVHKAMMSNRPQRTQVYRKDLNLLNDDGANTSEDDGNQKLDERRSQESWRSWGER